MSITPAQLKSEASLHEGFAHDTAKKLKTTPEDTGHWSTVICLQSAADRIEALEAALWHIAAPIDCGCKPCTSECRSDASKAVYFDQAQEIASTALKHGESK